MLKRLQKLILLGVLAVSMIMPNTIVFAADKEAMTEMQEETKAPEPETPAPQPNTKAPEPETPAPQPDTKAPEPETPAPQPDTKAPEPETPAPQPETKAPEPETPAPQPDTKAPEPETPAPQPDTPATEPDTKEPETEIPKQTDSEKKMEPQNGTKMDEQEKNQKQTEPLQDPTLHTTDGTGVTANIIGFSVDPSKYPAANVGENTVFIYQYLTSTMGLNHAGACGVLANIQLESNFNSLALGDGGSSYGICQWHNGRFNNLISYCNRNGLDYNTVGGQLQYLNHELANSYPSVLSYVKNVPDTAQGAYDAAYYWCMYFEVPDHTVERAVQRGNLAKNEYFGKKFEMDDTVIKADSAQSINVIRGHLDAKGRLDDIRGQMSLEERLTSIRIHSLLNN